MPATIPATANETVVRCQMEDYFGEDVNKTFVLAGNVTDLDLADILNSFEQVTNARFKSVTITRSYAVTGMRTTAVNALERNIGNQCVLGFVKPDPINPAKNVTRTFTIPAHVAAIQNADTTINYEVVGTPTTAPEHLGHLITMLLTRLQFKAADGTFHPGNWTFSEPASGFATVPNVIDGQ